MNLLKNSQELREPILNLKSTNSLLKMATPSSFLLKVQFYLIQGRLMNLGCATGHPSFVMSASFTNQTLAQLELWENTTSQKYKTGVYKLPRILDEKVARLHLTSFEAKLTILENDQAEYIDVKVEGPFKKEDYRYWVIEFHFLFNPKIPLFNIHLLFYFLMLLLSWKL